MSSLTEPTNATTTRREPVLNCYEDSPDAVRAFDASLSHQVAEHAGRPVLIVPPPR